MTIIELMTIIEFQRKACEFVSEFSNSVNTQQIQPEEVIIEFTKFTKTTKSCMLSTNINDGRYYEVVYNQEKEQLDLILISKEVVKLKKLKKGIKKKIQN